MRRAQNTRQGQTIVLMSLFIGFLFAMSSLAFDLGFVMLVRAKLVSAVDAATMSAIRFVPQGTGAMQAAAQRTFEANLPVGQFLLTNPTLNAPTLTTTNGAVQVEISGSVDAPLFFARMFGKDSLTLAARTVTARRDRNIILILDYSGSVDPVLSDIKNAAVTFVNSFSDSYDAVGLAAFSTSGRIVYQPQKNFSGTLPGIINGMQSQRYTNKAAGLYWAYRALLELNDPIKDLKNNEIVFFTDGRANWFPAQFDVSTAGGCPSSPVTGVLGINDGSVSAYRNRVLSMEASSTWDQVPPLTPDCNSWPWGTNYITAIRPTWYPDDTSTGVSIFPGGVSLSGYWAGSPALGPNPTNNQRRQIAKNVLDNLARLIRKDTTLNPRVHAIGYSGTGGTDVDVLERVANCDGCSFVDAADANDADQAKGRFVLASSSDELLTAFLDVAGFIGRIIQ